eukprot:TRINITY_DN13001_c0_g1_i1.p1 TRINITY_DN13001_c0_g1~~TRINITY_DN13001_c0_g1_i1.p1  ORF type:complete len:343 (-),score=90.40 TRINITY_DN13001_c0_g1_i1:38-985(-)
MAMIPIYFGSRLSLQYKNVGNTDKEVMTAKDAYRFPLVGSAMLFGLYIVFKVFNKDLINLLLTAYFLFLGFFSLVKTLSHFMAPVLAPLGKSPIFTFPAVPYLFEKPTPCSLGDIVVGIISATVIFFYVTTKYWILNNVLGLSFSIQGVALFTLGSYKIGCILLSGLFFYDIFWVFGTDVMVTVAKSFDAPIKLLFPKTLWAAEYQFSMLGLGDIVIPGIFIALLLRYDSHRNATLKKTDGSTPYFNNTLVGYFVGLATTIFVMHTFQAAQPALLYLVPTCLGSSLYTAFSLGDFNALWGYSEEEEENAEEKKKQ